MYNHILPIIIMKPNFSNPPSPRPLQPTLASSPSPNHEIKQNSQTDPQMNQQAGPHKHRHRPLTKSWTNPSFIGANIAILGFSIWFVYEALIYSKPSFWVIALVIYAVLFVFTYWSYWMTVCSDPGRVPFFYGYTPQLNFEMPRKYCLMCHNFKPERTHHCSSCQRCVLNMDHHCPWVNNCIGYQNRKYFILFVFYISIGLLFALTISIIVLIQEIHKSVQTNQTDGHLASKILLVLVAAPLTFALISFMVFHVKMVINNTTTLEGIIRRKNTEGEEFVDDYDVGFEQNCMQILGQNIMCWPCPLPYPGPKGNGMDWPKPNWYQTEQTKDYQRVHTIDNRRQKIAAYNSRS